MKAPKLSHIDAKLRPQMVDVSAKVATARSAEALAQVWFPAPVAHELGLDQARPDGDLVGPKGSVFTTAMLAGIMAAKKTSELIPLCHPLPLDKVDVAITALGEGVVEIRTLCRTHYQTGVEMEALTAASVAALTIYDMTKALSHEIEIRSIRLLKKTGGQSDYAAP